MGLELKADRQSGDDFDDLFPALVRIFETDPRRLSAYREAYSTAREFRRKVIEPRALEIDRRAMADPTWVDREVLRHACEYRLFSQLLPKMMGGAGTPFGAISIACEELSAGCVGIANLIFVNGLALACVTGTFDLRVLFEFADVICESEKTGIPRLLSTAITEPGAGSDVEDDDLVTRADLCCHARPVSGGFILNGRKVFISNGSLADTHVVFMPTEPSHPRETTQLFRVRTGAKGFHIGRVERKMGQKACPAAELVFEDCFVPRSDLLSREPTFVRLTDLALGMTRGGVGAFGTGVARGAFERAQVYCREHELDGRPMIEHQWIQFKLARMLENVLSARRAYVEALLVNERFGLLYMMEAPLMQRMNSLLPDRVLTSGGLRRFLQTGVAARLIRKMTDELTPEAMRRSSRAGAAAKVLCTDLAMENCSLALDLMGSHGIRHDRGMEKLYRDAKLLQIYEGTNQINSREVYKSSIGSPAEA